uniref:glycosyltransferase n=1 Tax=uncultured Halomonas sp. TaxID=173971 RepID=UPI0026180C3E|nr:glycosyltransferase [uncultured Halomonas sp.]
MSIRFCICVPTLNAGTLWPTWLAKTLPACRGHNLLVIDSSSDDDTACLAREAGAEVVIIDRNEFNHGGTRSWALKYLKDAEVVVFLTQDAIPCGIKDIENLVACFSDPTIGAAFGRQLPHDNATAIAKHGRYFNYPNKSYVVGPQDIPRLGVKTAFLSNSFAAYRRKALLDAGGFTENVILSEDMLAGARLLQADWQLAYCAEARVYHSHNYSLVEECGRYFDIGVLHAREAWLLEWLGRAEGEGLRFVRSELRYLLRDAPHRLPEAGLRTLFKYAGYRLGRMEQCLPLRLKRQLSMHRRFWNR